SIRWRFERTDYDVINDCLRDLRKYGHHSRLVAFAGDNQSFGIGMNIALLERECLRETQAGAVKQSQYRRVTRDDPWLARLTFAQVGGGNLHGGRNSYGLWQCFRSFGRAHCSERGNLALPLALEETRERTYSGKRTHQRATAGSLAAPGRHEGAHIGRRKFG